MRIQVNLYNLNVVSWEQLSQTTPYYSHRDNSVINYKVCPHWKFMEWLPASLFVNLLSLPTFAPTFLLYLLFTRQISTNAYLVNIFTSYRLRYMLFYGYTPLDFVFMPTFFHLVLCFQLFIPNLLDTLHWMMPCVLVVQISEEIGFSFLKTFVCLRPTCTMVAATGLVCVWERVVVGTFSSPRRVYTFGLTIHH